MNALGLAVFLAAIALSVYLSWRQRDMLAGFVYGSGLVFLLSVVVLR